MNNKKLRLALIIFISASFLAIAASLYLNTRDDGFAGEEDRGAKEARDEADNSAGEVIKDVVYTTIGGEGKGNWTLKALSAVRKDEVLALRQVDLLYTDTKADEVVYTLKGNSGSFDEGLGRVGLEGDVRVLSSGGETLRTGSLDYIVSERIAVTDDQVLFELNDGISVEGLGLEMNFDSGRFVVKEDVRMVIRDRRATI
ncbi:MAG: LPS export ABC transporter periplasmic protein LptC [Deltaproteobacteria bacterium]|nr:LPS export ABC transporter periplasmic protein LptC [Deltaproteobacteria bacterium]